MMSEKTVGYTLVALGVACIIFAALSVYMVFTKKAQPVELFSLPAISIDPSQMVANNPTGSTGPKTELISAPMLNESSNLFAHLMLMGFIASVGSKIASIGVMMVRPVIVKLRGKEETVSKIDG